MSWTSFKTVKKFAVVSATCALSLATLSYYNGPRTSYCENQLHEPISCKNFVKQYKVDSDIDVLRFLRSVRFFRKSLGFRAW